MDFSGLLATYCPETALIKEVHQMSRMNNNYRTLERQLANIIVRYGSLDDMRVLLSAGAEVDAPVCRGLRLIHYASFQCYKEAVNLLLELGCDPNIMDDAGYTAMHLCAEKGYTDIIKLLIQHDARVCFTDLRPKEAIFGELPINSFADEPLRLAIKNDQYEAAELLLQHGADANARYFLGHEINLVDSTELNFVELLLKYGADPNAKDRYGMTPLMKACRKAEALDTATLLVNHGANVHLMTDEDQDLRTAMHYAVISGSVETVKLLLANGASACLSTEYHKPTPLYFAVLKGNVRMLKFLIEKGAFVNGNSQIIGSPLHIALCEKIPNKKAIVEILLESGANPNAITESDTGPLLKPPLGEYFNSCEQPSLELVQLLLKYGARVILKGQRQHPLGILRTFHRLHLGLTPEVASLVVEAAEEFCTLLIQSSDKLSVDQKELMLKSAFSPRPLKHAARRVIRLWLGTGPHFIQSVQDFPIPDVLKRYLLFEV